MNSVVLVFIGFAVFFMGYKFYSRYLGRNIYGINDDQIVLPSSSLEDGIDYIPTKKHILFGHHFTSIAGAAPIIGPCILGLATCSALDINWNGIHGSST